jgi:hypothetical protein
MLGTRTPQYDHGPADWKFVHQDKRTPLHCPDYGSLFTSVVRSLRNESMRRAQTVDHFLLGRSEDLLSQCCKNTGTSRPDKLAEEKKG